MVLRPDRGRFWRGWRRNFRRLGIIIPAAFMVTLLLIAFDWSSLRALHVEWLLTIASLLLVVLWAGIAVALVAIAVIAISLRKDRLELEDGLLRRRLLLAPNMEVLVEGATLKRLPGTTIVRGAAGKGRVLVPHLFYSQQDLDRLWSAAGLSEVAADVAVAPR